MANTVPDSKVFETIASINKSKLSVTLTHLLGDRGGLSTIYKSIQHKTEKIGDPNTLAELCAEYQWQYMTDLNAQGTEDECFVLYRRPYHPIYPEYLAR